MYSTHHFHILCCLFLFSFYVHLKKKEKKEKSSYLLE